MVSSSSSCPSHGLWSCTWGRSVFSPRLAPVVLRLGEGCVLWKGVGGCSVLAALVGRGGRGGLVLPRILITCPGSQGTSCPCSLFMIRVEVPGSSFMLCLGPGPPSLLHLTRANAEKPYAGDTLNFRMTRHIKAIFMDTQWLKVWIFHFLETNSLFS